jgi:AraC-like DNA-binding protein
MLSPLEHMKTLDFQHEPHLALREFTVPPGGELPLRLSHWTVMQIGRGTGYFLQPNMNQALDAQTILVFAGRAHGSIRASQLSELTFHAFSVIPARLSGLITLSEQSGLEAAAARKGNRLQLIPPQNPLAATLAEWCAQPIPNGMLLRVKLLQLFIELVGDKLDLSLPDEEISDARQRLQLFLKQTSSFELLEMDFNELAQKTHCTSRHLGRIFKELVGMSFNAKRDALRMERARELLATGHSKIVDVALESGYKSLSHFNHMFARSFGMSPSRWRKKNERNGAPLNKNKAGKGNILSFSQFNMPASLTGNNDNHSGKSAGKKPGTTIYARESAGVSVMAK